MGFWTQLKYLLWKNFLLRSRQKVWTIAEFVCPLLLFLILVWVRLTIDIERNHACHYAPKALPSAGLIPFMQTWFCTISNQCGKEPLNDTSVGPANTPNNSVLLFVGKKVEKYLASDEFSLRIRKQMQTLPKSLEKLKNPTNTHDLIWSAIFGDQLAIMELLADHANIFEENPLLETVINLAKQLKEFSDGGDDLVRKFSCGKVGQKFNELFKEMTSTERLRERFRDKTTILEVGKTQIRASKSAGYPPEKDTPNMTVCESFLVEPNLDRKCLKWLTDLGLPQPTTIEFFAMLRGFILVAPSNNVTEQIIEKMNHILDGFNFFKEAILLFYENAEKWQDTLHQMFGDYYENLAPNYTERCLKKPTDECLERVDVLERTKFFFVDSNHTNATLVQWKNTIKPLAEVSECFLTKRFVAIKTKQELEERAMCLIEQYALFYAGLVFELDETKKDVTELPKFVKYHIRMPEYLVHGPSIKDKVWSHNPRDRPFIDMKYQDFGFQYLQDAVDRAIIEVQTNTTQNVGAYIQQFPNPCFQSDPFVRAIERTLPLLMVMAWVCSASLIIKNVVYEKEMRLKEFMKVMGLGNLVHWVAWFIQSFIFIIFSVFTFVVVLKYGGVVRRADFLVLFLFVLLFMVATITQCFLISTFFNKANLAAACGAIIYFLCFVPYWVVIRWAEKLDYTQKMSSCLFAQVAFGWGCSYIAHFEGHAEGVTWKTINVRAEGVNFTLSDALVMMVVDSIIHLVLTWYIETVFPGEYGIPRPFYFFFTKSYWCGERQSEKALEDLEDLTPEVKKYTESEPTELPLGVAVRHLKKTYKNGKVALSGISLNFYESQITSFLGHNGAGKTTTLSILTGLFPPTEGTVLVYGNDVRTRIDAIRKSLGMCPQHNILYGSLTVRQQLTFYAGLKGVPSKQIPLQVKEMIDELALGPKADTPSEDLSGGNQRRLAVAAAFIGGSKTVILDEPTAGVDPCARRLIWDLLLRKKEGRTIILSTHFMDEADVLGDRIAIIGAGKLRCCGSSMFLKKVYGSGYRLTMVRKNPSQARLQLMGAPAGPEEELPSLAVPTPSIKSSEEVKSSKSMKSTKQPGKAIAPPSPAPSSSEEGNKSSKSTKSATAQPEIDYDKKINEFVTSILPGSVVTEDVGHEFTYNVPSDNPEALKEFFVQLEQNMERLNLSSYGVSETKLEEIFLKAVGEEGGEEKKQKACPNVCPALRKKFSRWRKRMRNRGKPPDDPKLVDSSEDDSENTAREAFIDPNLKLIEQSSAPVVIARQMRALLAKRFVNFLRNVRGAFCEIILPIVLIAIVLYVLGLKPPVEERGGSVDMVPWKYPNSYIFQKLDYPLPDELESTDEEAEWWAQRYLGSLTKEPGFGIGCLANYSFHCGGKNPEVVDDDKPTNKTCYCDDRSVYNCPAGAYQPNPRLNITQTRDILVDLTNDYNNDSVVEHHITKYLLMTEAKFRLKRYGGFSFGDVNIAASNQSLNWTVVDENVHLLVYIVGNLSQAMGVNITVPPSELISEKVREFRYFLSGLDIRSNIKIWFSNQGWISGPVFASILSNAILRANLNESVEFERAQYGIRTTNHPMNYTKASQAAQLGTPSPGPTTFETCMVMLAFCIVPASFVLFVIEETISYSKHLQFVTGVRPIVYWVANFIWDMTNYMIPVALVMLVFLGFQEKAYIGDGRSAMATFILLVLYGFAIIPMMYPFTFVFRIPSLAFIMLTMGNSLIGWITSLTTMILQMMGESDKSMNDINDILRTVFLIFPQFCLARGLMDIKANYYAYEALKIMVGEEKAVRPDIFEWGPIDTKLPGMEQIPNLMTLSGIGRNIFCLIVSGCIWFIVTLIIEYRNELLRRFKDDANRQNTSEDEDVRRERERITSDNNKESYALKIKNLTKVFASGCGAQRKILRAVDNLCVGVPPGECFGLLGVNGAGKTTTFSMLTGKLTVTSGDALVNGASILSNMDQVCHQIGYCPQFDALHPLLSAREELRFYARLRGVKSAYMDKVVNRSILQLGLRAYADRQCGTYSGGNKRKLSTAIAMIGNPAVVLLDEPTTGMDPKARRFLWNRIMEILRDGKTSVILTSHSMEECEALCHRIGIMVNGRFRCLGSAQHLKSRFGQGYTLTIKIGGTKPKTAEAIEFIKRRFPGVELKEQHLSQLRFQLPLTVKALSDVFACMVDAVKVLQIDDYTLSQTTLEEVFVSFAREQGNAEKERTNRRNNPNQNTGPVAL